MRYINIAELEPRLPLGWEQKAKRALERVKKLPPAKRAKTINRLARIWQDLGGVLSELSYGKCWYCETIEKRSDYPVDHFRPKNRVDECADHEGYWWLAFSWQNYRLSCTYCNSRRNDEVEKSGGGKHDHFPLLDETKRAYQEDDDWTLEEPELLDPTRPADPTFLWFADDGRVVEKYNHQKYPIQYQRAHTSIEIYHLNHRTIRDARKALYGTIRKKLRDGRIYFERWHAGDGAAKHGFDEVMNELRQLIDKRAEYSAFARAMLLGFRDADYPWVDGVFTSH